MTFDSFLSLVAAKAGDSGRPPAPGELMAAASALGTISLFNPSFRGSIEGMETGYH
jgi:hypothetical protein